VPYARIAQIECGSRNAERGINSLQHRASLPALGWVNRHSAFLVPRFAFD
jgi:hypothetical protein